MLEPANYDMSLIIGAIWSSPIFTFEDKDLTGCEIQVNIADEDGNIVESLNTSSGVTVDVANKKFMFGMSAADTASKFVPGNYNYSVWITEIDPLEKNKYVYGILEATS